MEDRQETCCEGCEVMLYSGHSDAVTEEDDLGMSAQQVRTSLVVFADEQFGCSLDYRADKVLN